jgi:hypothetical protein
MSTTIETVEAAKSLPDGQWIQDADGDYACLIDTHMGFPQRMAMSKGGRYLAALHRLTFPLSLADFVGDCEHKWGLIGEGHCRRCGHLIAWSPVVFDEEVMDTFHAAAKANEPAPELTEGERATVARFGIHDEEADQ